MANQLYDLMTGSDEIKKPSKTAFNIYYSFKSKKQKDKYGKEVPMYSPNDLKQEFLKMSQDYQKYLKAFYNKSQSVVI